MPRPITMATATLLTATVAGVLPSITSSFASRQPLPSPPVSFASVGPPPPPTSISPHPYATANIGQVVGLGAQRPAMGNASPAVETRIASSITNDSPIRVFSNGSSEDVTFTPNGKTLQAHLVFENRGGEKQVIKVTLLLRDRGGAQIENARLVEPGAKEFPVNPHSLATQTFKIGFASVDASGAEKPVAIDWQPLLPASGILQFNTTLPTSDDKKPLAGHPDSKQPQLFSLTRPITIPRPAMPDAPRVGHIVLLSLCIAAFVVVVTAIRLLVAHVSLIHRMGAGTWSFGQSWGANVTIGAGLLGTFLALTAFPEYPKVMERSSFTLLQVLFAAVIALAPFVYGVIRQDFQANQNGIAVTDSQGYVVMFLLAGGLVLWGAIGQVITLAVLLKEFSHGGVFAPTTFVILETIAGILMFLLFIYGLRSLYITASELSQDPATASSERPRPSLPNGMPLPMPLSEELKPPMANWTFL